MQYETRPAFIKFYLSFFHIKKGLINTHKIRNKMVILSFYIVLSFFIILKLIEI